MTWRLLGNLIRHLPPESATKTAMRNQMSGAEMEQVSRNADPSQGQWSHLEMLIASGNDMLRWIAYILSSANGGKPKKPEPTPRPGVNKGAKRRQLTPEQQEAVFRRINGGSVAGTWQQTEPGKITHLPRR